MGVPSGRTSLRGISSSRVRTHDGTSNASAAAVKADMKGDLFTLIKINRFGFAVPVRHFKVEGNALALTDTGSNGQMLVPG